MGCRRSSCSELTLAGPCSEGAVIGAGAAYASLDGAVWSELPFGEQAFAAGAAMAGERVVVGTDARNEYRRPHRRDLLDQRGPMTARRIIGA